MGDAASVALPGASFDAVAAFYSIIHVPRDEQRDVPMRVSRWLRPGGLLVAALGAADLPGEIEPRWFGAPMYWSSFDAEANRAAVREAGLRIESAVRETAREGGEEVSFLWVVARKDPGR